MCDSTQKYLLIFRSHFSSCKAHFLIPFHHIWIQKKCVYFTGHQQLVNNFHKHLHTQCPALQLTGYPVRGGRHDNINPSLLKVITGKGIHLIHQRGPAYTSSSFQVVSIITVAHGASTSQDARGWKQVIPVPYTTEQLFIGQVACLLPRLRTPLTWNCFLNVSEEPKTLSIPSKGLTFRADQSDIRKSGFSHHKRKKKKKKPQSKN